MSPKFSIIFICLCEIQVIFTIDNQLIQIEENLLYAQLNTPANLNSFYRKLLESNDIDDFTRIQRIATQKDIQQLDLENKVRQKNSME